MRVIARGELGAWLDGLAARERLIAPVEVEGVVLYRTVKSSAEIAPLQGNASRPVLSVKEVFFPPTERLLLIGKAIGPGDGTRGQIRLRETLPEGEQIVFGVRPCDARGMRALDAAFLHTQPADPYYARRRENTVLIGLTCPEMGPSCFCRSVGGAPDDPSDVDLMLTETDKGYGVQTVTEKGRALLAGVEVREVEGTVPRSGLNEPIPIPDILAWPPHFQDEFWQHSSERCLSCRICAYVCPTCRCFAVRDEALPSAEGEEGFERIRCWDSCAGDAYRRIAGGHNPRSEKGQRLRNRYFCKFYYYPQQYGPVACTGCGRCIESCPVNIDITEILAHLVTG
jgi:sulfhydrogenase subunit beta (sulfur reductase)